MITIESQIRTLSFPFCRDADWRELLHRKLNQIDPGKIELNCRDWHLSCRELTQIETLLQKAGLKVVQITSDIPETLVAASALGYRTKLNLQITTFNSTTTNDLQTPDPKNNPKLLFHQGTLRSGENLEAEHNVLLIGDVNPGAKISADGDVMIWGRLRGTAHAGKSGNTAAKIVALQLRPLQLRIANQVARGPEESPQEGLAEEALIKDGIIIIQPATSNSFKND